MTAVVSSPETGLRRTVLPNGLTVLSEWMPGVRSVAFGAWVRSSSVHESREQMGISHLLEHMVFKGTKSRGPREIASSIESLGGSLDAYTAREHTAFQARVLDEHLGEAVHVIGELLFHPLLRAEDLTLERNVILEEISQVDDTPDDLVFEVHNETLWGAHPYGYSILGTRDTVNALTADDLRALHERAYHPDRVVVAASGNVEHEHLLQVLEAAGWFDVKSSGTSRPEAPPAPVPKPRTKRVRRKGAQTHIVMGSTAVPHGDPRRYPMGLVSMLLGDGMSSRLFQRVREELGLAYSVYTFQEYYHHSGVHGVYVGTAPDTAAKAEDAVRAELDSIVNNSFPAEEIAAGKRQLKGQITLSLESVASRMYRAAGTELYGEPYKTLDQLLAEIDAIEPQAVAAVCREFYGPERQTVVRLGPGPKKPVTTNGTTSTPTG